MATNGQLTGMRGVFLVASEMTKCGLIVSTTSRNAIGADILATDINCTKAYSVQVKTNAKTFNFWLLSKKAVELQSKSLIYVFVNIKQKETEEIEYYVVPSKYVAANYEYQESANSDWYSISLGKIEKFKDKWNLFEIKDLP